MSDPDRTHEPEPDDVPALRFADGEEVRLTIPRRAPDGQQLPNGALGHILAAVDLEGSSFEVEFTDFEGMVIEEGEDRGIPVRAVVPQHALQPVTAPQVAETVEEPGEPEDESLRRDEKGEGEK